MRTVGRNGRGTSLLDDPALHGDQACRGEQTDEDDPDADVQRAERRRIDKSVNRLEGQHEGGASEKRSLREAR